MVTLNEVQQRELAELARLKENYANDVNYWEADLRRRRSELKEPMRDQVDKLVELEVPMRQIHLAMGMKQVNQLTAFLSPTTNAEKIRESLSGRKDGNESAPTPVAKSASITEVGRDKFEYVRENGEQFVFLFNSNTGWFEQETPKMSDEIKDEIYTIKPEWAKIRDRAFRI